MRDKILLKDGTINLAGFLAPSTAYALSARQGAIRVERFENQFPNQYQALAITSIYRYLTIPKYLRDIACFGKRQAVAVRPVGSSIHLVADFSEGYQDPFPASFRKFPRPKYLPRNSHFFEQARQAEPIPAKLSDKRVDLRGVLPKEAYRAKAAVSLFRDDTCCWAEVRIDPPAYKTPSINKEAFEQLYRVPLSEKLDGVTYADAICDGRLRLPSMFCSLFAQGAKQLPAWQFQPGVFIIELPAKHCSGCGQEVRSTEPDAVKAHFCGCCQTYTGQNGAVQALFKASKAMKNVSELLS